LGLQFGKRFQKNIATVPRLSWFLEPRSGTHKIVFVPFDANARPQGYYEDFLTGFATQLSRPLGADQLAYCLADGSLLLTEEANNRIYRIQYQG